MDESKLLDLLELSEEKKDPTYAAHCSTCKNDWQASGEPLFNKIVDLICYKCRGIFDV